MKGGFVLYNGKFFRADEKLFSGDELFRLEAGIKIWFRTEDNEILFHEQNYAYLCAATRAINLVLPEDFDLGGARLRRDVSRLLNKNKFYLAGRVVVYLFPGVNGTDVLLTAEEIPRGFFPMNENGLLIDIFNEGRKSDTVMNPYETGSRFLWLIAAAKAQSLHRQNMILMNRAGFCCEGIGTSFGYIHENVLYVPSGKSEGYRVVLTEMVREAARQAGFMAAEKDEISTSDLEQAEEVFLIDNALGIQWVLGIGNRRYYSTKTFEIVKKLQLMAQNKKAFRNAKG
ncbi:aminotransferase class IV [Prolixibacter bellariivorans]|uniref:aminotransferase class IV n=1 Tax=Prolixibacter bellariivorans TaxID=314319 RepID=UPI00048232DC|nr:aminotransferase class IV [Prolixibacter bellariivorans]